MWTLNTFTAVARFGVSSLADVTGVFWIPGVRVLTSRRSDHRLSPPAFTSSPLPPSPRHHRINSPTLRRPRDLNSAENPGSINDLSSPPRPTTSTYCGLPRPARRCPPLRLAHAGIVPAPLQPGQHARCDPAPLGLSHAQHLRRPHHVRVEPRRDAVGRLPERVQRAPQRLPRPAAAPPAVTHKPVASPGNRGRLHVPLRRVVGASKNSQTRPTGSRRPPRRPAPSMLASRSRRCKS
ncbi:uncharacterized protein A4U43_C09F16050 [Asparagus officinalis]|uniref:Uncharacterized protein n=1 Tax=Asparagus officinalis TaxID=4686 RepID=A0A5P1E833_ASPOF|nr:uncharacterized protein A4U43_C09F16050 [Asparagus officinalis]